MPSFILRELDPEFWARVQAKAAAEGVTVKARILELLKTWLGAAAAIALLFLAAGCVDPKVPNYVSTAPSATTAPPPTPTPPLPVAALTVDLRVSPSVPRVNRQAALVADVRDLQGSGATYAWNFGDGTSLVTTATFAQHTYRSLGDVLASVRVTEASGRTADAVIGFTIDREPDPPETPTTTTPVTPTGLNGSLRCTPKPVGEATPCNVTASYNGNVLPSAAIQQVDWDFGDGSTQSTNIPTHARWYTTPGTYTIFATVLAVTADGLRVVIVTTVVEIP